MFCLVLLGGLCVWVCALKKIKNKKKQTNPKKKRYKGTNICARNQRSSRQGATSTMDKTMHGGGNEDDDSDTFVRHGLKLVLTPAMIGLHIMFYN